MGVVLGGEGESGPMAQKASEDMGEEVEGAAALGVRHKTDTSS